MQSYIERERQRAPLSTGSLPPNGHSCKDWVMLKLEVRSFFQVSHVCAGNPHAGAIFHSLFSCINRDLDHKLKQSDVKPMLLRSAGVEGCSLTCRAMS